VVIDFQPQQLRGILLGLDDVGKVFRIFVGGVLFFAAVAVLRDAIAKVPWR
jgi:hypothetical protein